MRQRISLLPFDFCILRLRAKPGAVRRPASRVVSRRRVSRVLFPRVRPFESTAEVIISLERALPRASSDLPADRTSRAWGVGPFGPVSAYLVLLPVGFALPSESPRTRCALTAPFHPY